MSTDIERLLKQRYYINDSETWAELSWRVSAYICEKNSPLQRQVYKDILEKVWLPNSPCLVNAGKPKNPGLLACYVAGPGEDDLSIHIDTLKDIAQVAKFGGGCGFSATHVRPKNKPVAGSTHGYSYGPINYALKVSDYMDMMTQSGFRSMALMFTMRSDHEDLDEFIDMKQNENETIGYNFNQSIMVKDEWMEKAIYDPDSKEATQFEKIVVNAWSNGEPGMLFYTTINKNTPYDEPIETSNPCQPGFANILTKEGIRTFDDIEIGSEIWSEDGWVIVTSKRHSGNKPVFEYTTTGGKFIGTSEHRIVSRGDKIEVKYADSIDLLTGIAVVDSQVSHNIQAVVDGIVLGDGSRHTQSKEKVYLTIGENDKDYFTSEISEYIIAPHAVKYGVAWKIKTDIVHSELPPTYERVIPQRYYCGSFLTVASFLRGLFSANGCVVDNRISLKATSFEIIAQAQEMLSSIGIRSYYTTNKAKLVTHHNGTYESKQSYDLNITSDREVFKNTIGFIQKYKQEKLNLSCSKIISKIGVKTHDIISKNYLGDYDVYDISVDGSSHTYWSSCVSVSNCGEQLLPEYGACCLGSINITHDRFYDKYDNFKFHELENVVDTATEFLDLTGTKTAFPNEKFQDWYGNNRPIGIGIMGYADALLRQGVKYGFIEALSFLENVMETIQNTAKIKSHELGKELGFPQNSKDRRNITVVSIAPTGSIAFIAGCSHGIEPVFSPIYNRTDERGESYIFKHNLRNEDYFVSAINDYQDRTVSWKEHLDTQLSAQKFCDSGVSKTINFPSYATVEEVKNAFVYAWQNGAKGLTVYRDQSRQKQVLETLTEEDAKKQSCPSGVCDL